MNKMYKIHLKRKIILFVDFGSLEKKSMFYQLSCYQHANKNPRSILQGCSGYGNRNL